MVWGLGCRVQVLGFQVQGVWFGVQGLNQGGRGAQNVSGKLVVAFRGGRDVWRRHLHPGLGFEVYRSTSLIGKRLPLGPYSRLVPTAL